MLYYMHELQRLAMAPARVAAEATMHAFRHPMNPLRDSELGRQFASAAEVFEHATRRYGKPAFGLDRTAIDGRAVRVEEEILITRAWCQLIRFRRAAKRDDPKLLIVAPLSGHFATLLRGTVETMLPDHDVHITDWKDARNVPLAADQFNLNDYIDYIIDFLHFLGPNTHVLAVCQPSAPVLAAVSVMSGWGDNCVPATMTLMGGPIDTRENPTQVNRLAMEHGLDWFEHNVIQTVPPPYAGMGRRVYPGFIQLTNFISMNFERHLAAQGQLFDHLVRGDDDAAEKKRSFYEEYLAVMDLTADFYLQTVETVFQTHALPKGEMMARWHPVEPDKIMRTAILCVEGGLDDISGIGQTKAALEITHNLSSELKAYHLQENVGHYGVFNGSRWRASIAPKLKEFIRDFDREIGRRRDLFPSNVTVYRGVDRRAAAAKPSRSTRARKTAAKRPKP